ncbi:MAG: TrbC/VirB2 family protein [Novosphingobium sp.]
MSISNISGNSIDTLLSWMVQMATGPAASILATLALAGLGFTALTGNLTLNQVVRVLAGIFILFGAPQIAVSLLDLRSAEFAAANGDRMQPTADQPHQANSICWTC